MKSNNPVVQRLIDASEPITSEPITILELAEFILGKPATNGQDFEDAGLPMLGGCEQCGATIAAYNACPSKTGYLRCQDGCIGDFGYYSVEQARREIFGWEPDDSEEVLSDATGENLPFCGGE